MPMEYTPYWTELDYSWERKKGWRRTANSIFRLWSQKIARRNSGLEDADRCLDRGRNFSVKRDLDSREEEWSGRGSLLLLRLKWDTECFFWTGVSCQRWWWGWEYNGRGMGSWFLWVELGRLRMYYGFRLWMRMGCQKCSAQWEQVVRYKWKEYRQVYWEDRIFRSHC